VYVARVVGYLKVMRPKDTDSLNDMMSLGYAGTVITQLAYLVASLVEVAVTVVSPVATPVTTPLALTVAMPGTEDTQVTVSGAPPATTTVGTRVWVASAATVRVAWSRATEVTVPCTVMVVCPWTVFVWTDVAVIMVVPSATPVTSPLASTVAAASVPDAQVTVFKPPAETTTEAASCCVALYRIVGACGVTVTDDATPSIVACAAPNATQLVPLHIARIGVSDVPPSEIVIYECFMIGSVATGAVAFVYWANVVGNLKAVRPKLVTSRQLMAIPLG
jgi:hypothetical protein